MQSLPFAARNTLLHCLTFLLTGFVPAPLLGDPAVHAYTIYCLVVLATVALTCMVADETPRDEALPFRLSELVAAYSIDVVANSDFFGCCS